MSCFCFAKTQFSIFKYIRNTAHYYTKYFELSNYDYRPSVLFTIEVSAHLPSKKHLMCYKITCYLCVHAATAITCSIGTCSFWYVLSLKLLSWNSVPSWNNIPLITRIHRNNIPLMARSASIKMIWILPIHAVGFF